jgi:tetratricopeptide (TPR) repeat protein
MHGGPGVEVGLEGRVMSTSERVENTRLRMLMREAGCTGQVLAHQVNVTAAEVGLSLHYDRTSVGHWLAGTRPPAYVAGLVAESLSRLLGRPVTAVDAGLGEHEEQAPGRESADGANRLEVLHRLGRGHRAALRPSAYSLILPASPSFADAAAWPRQATGDAAEPGPRRVGTAQAEAAALMVQIFSDTDSAHGGGRGRPALTSYLATDMVWWLRAPAVPAARRRLMGTAARLTYLAGFMNFDENRQGAAQGYYRHAIALAAEAGDQQVYATVLRAMSVQAFHLGHFPRALDLAESAAREAQIVAPGHGAFLIGQLAVAAAGAGDRWAAVAHLDRAERYLSRADTGAAAGFHSAALLVQEAEVRAAAGDLAGAVAALETSLRARPPAERRARAVSSARLAGFQLDLGHLEAACTVVHTIIDDQQYLDSGRVDTALAKLRARLRPYQRNPAAGGVLERLSHLIAIPEPANEMDFPR